MAWIDTVAPYSTILSTWGNSIRDRVVHQFASKAERDSTSAPVEGMVCVTLDTNVVYVRTDGAWWVLAMPWRTFAARAWIVYQGTPANAPVLNTIFAKWCQSMGTAHVRASLAIGPTQYFNANVNVWAWTPAGVAGGGQCGHAHVYMNHDGQVYGGGATFVQNDSTGSIVVVNNVGNGVPPNAAPFLLSGNANFNIDMNLTYDCNPAQDA